MVGVDAALHFEVDGAGHGPRAAYGIVDHAAAARAAERQCAVHVAGCSAVGDAEARPDAEAEQLGARWVWCCSVLAAPLRCRRRQVDQRCLLWLLPLRVVWTGTCTCIQITQDQRLSTLAGRNGISSSTSHTSSFPS